MLTYSCVYTFNDAKIMFFLYLRNLYLKFVHVNFFSYLCQRIYLLFHNIMKTATIKLLTFLVVLMSAYVLFSTAQVITSSFIQDEGDYITIAISGMTDIVSSIVFFGIYIAMLCKRKAMQLTKASITGIALTLVAIALYYLPVVYAVTTTILSETGTIGPESAALLPTISTISSYTKSILYIIAFALIVQPTQIPTLGKVAMIAYPTLQFLRWMTLEALYKLDWNAITTLSLRAKQLVGHISHLSIAVIVLILMIVSLRTAKKQTYDDEAVPTLTEA